MSEFNRSALAPNSGARALNLLAAAQGRLEPAQVRLVLCQFRPEDDIKRQCAKIPQFNSDNHHALQIDPDLRK